MPPARTWTKKGQAHQHRVKGRWGSEGRLNLMGTLRVEGEGHERLEYRMLEGSCDSGEVLLYLDALVSEAQRDSKPCVVVLDNAPFHTAGVIREREEEWEARGLRLYRLPAYCPHLNLIEGVWRRLKGFLMPRRFYDSVGELKRAVLHALRLLGAVEVHIQLGDT
ncbi:MAG TPA: IS630 family transposase [Rubrobacter sp.]|nr:IS630 family transposase [Rubrobacter sp.]